MRGKRKRHDVQEFASQLPDYISELHHTLSEKTYRHGPYEHFKISDPKPRDIHKATVRDRLVHHAVYRILYSFFDRTFIADSFSCRLHKGTHRALNRLRTFAYQVSKNHTKTCWILKCDIRKFFATIDHAVLLEILARSIPDPNIFWLLREIIGSFSSGTAGKGLPLGNLTSQLLVNIYMNEFDQFVKHKLKIKHYIRYADDFILFSQNQEYLATLIPTFSDFLSARLKLSLHSDKVFIKTLSSGVDFLGWVHFPDHRALRTATKLRMFSRVSEQNLSSYLGMLAHGDTYQLQKVINALV